MSDGLTGGWSSVVILGLVEGLTEFLPVSSTGHLIVIGHLLGEHSEEAKVFDIFIQLGAILAVGWHERRRLVRMFCNLPSSRLALNLAIAFMPAAVLGLLFHGLIKAHLFSPFVVAGALIVGGVVIIVVERRRITPRITDVEDLRPRDALVIGLAQALALFPGVSRAGATIIGGVLWGVQRRAATEFSFLLALPTMFAAVFYDLSKNWQLLNPSFALELLVGAAISFVAALLVIRALLRFVSAHDFTLFGWYRVGFGVIIFLFPGLFAG